MRRQIQRHLIAFGITLLCLLPLKASATAISGIYVFGDSLSDTGNVFQASLLAAGTGLPAPPYFEGRFSNGYLWVDYLAERLGFRLTPATQLSSDTANAISFAYGGATTGTSNTVNTALPGLQQEIQQFQQFVAQQKVNPQQKADSNALYTLWIGSNDYLNSEYFTSKIAETPEPSQPVNNISAAIRKLYDLGARHFLVANLTNLGETPLAQTLSPETVPLLNRLTRQHNLFLDRQLNSLQRSLPQLDLIRLDVHRLFEQAKLGQLSFSDVRTPCLNRATGQVCKNPDQHLFWDSLHPTTIAHRYVAESAAKMLQTQAKQQNSPKVSSFPGLMLLGTLSLIASAGVIWRKKRIG